MHLIAPCMFNNENYSRIEIPTNLDLLKPTFFFTIRYRQAFDRDLT